MNPEISYNKKQLLISLVELIESELDSLMIQIEEDVPEEDWRKYETKYEKIIEIWRKLYDEIYFT